MSLIKTADQVNIMAEGGKILAAVLTQVAALVKPGVSTLELDASAEKLILEHGAKPAFKNYKGFPYSLCTSINHDIVHGLPSKRILKVGDIITLDLGVLHKGYNTDMAITVPVGEISFEAKRLLKVTEKALRLGIKKVRAGVTTGDIGNTIQRFIEDQGYGVVRDLCGHGIGTQVHEDPYIPNFGKRHTGTTLQEGMVICIEPMVTVGDHNIIKSEDGYGFATRDGSLSAHFEHTVAVTKDGARLLTKS